MATYTTSNPGNRAIEEQVWTLSTTEAKQVQTVLDTRKGSYWDTNLVKPTRRAVRQHAQAVRIYTAGFSTAELSNALYATASTGTA